MKGLDSNHTLVTSTHQCGTTHGNGLPITTTTPPNLSINVDYPLLAPLPANIFNDPEGNNHLVYSAKLTNGKSLPSWLHVSSATGAFAGVPGPGNIQTYNITLTATDPHTHQSASVTLNLTVNPDPILLNPIPNVNVNEGTAVSFHITTGEKVLGLVGYGVINPNAYFLNTDPLAFKHANYGLTLSANIISPAGALHWLTFNPKTDTFSGTPNSPLDAGTYNITVNATNCQTTVHESFILTVNGPTTLTGPGSLTFPAPFQEASSESASIMLMNHGATAQTITGFSFVSFDGKSTSILPSWLTTNLSTFVNDVVPGSGSITPSLTLSAALGNNPGELGSHTLVFDLLSGSSTIPITVNFTIADPPLHISPTGVLPVSFVGASVSDVLTASGAPGPYTFVVDPLPAGLSLNGNTISDTPSVSGTFNFIIDITAADGQMVKDPLSLTVYPQLLITSPAISAATYQGASVSDTITATGGSGSESFVLASGSSLPPGLTLSTTGVLSGTAPSVATATTYTFTIQVQDTVDGQTTTQAESLTVYPKLALALNSAAIGEVGVHFNDTLSAATGGNANYTYTITGFPAGSGLSALANTISGIPTANDSGTLTVTEKVTDTLGESVSQPVSITIFPALGITGSAPAAGFVNAVYNSDPVTVSGGVAPDTFSYTIISNTLPNATTVNPFGDLIFNPLTGGFTGTPTFDGSVTFTETVTDSLHATATTSSPMTLMIHSPTIFVVPSSVDYGTVGQGAPAGIPTVLTIDLTSPAPLGGEQINIIPVGATSFYNLSATR